MKKQFFRVVFLTVGMMIALVIKAQDNRTLVVIDGDSVSVDEFMRVYRKNNVKGDTIDSKSIKEYLQLFINFKLKVKEAEALGMDTVSSFVKELEGYRDQLAEPYFVDESIIDELVDEAYKRSTEDIRASHILIRVGPNALPEDTIKAYNKAMEALAKVKKGEPFEKVAKEMSEDESARDRVSPRTGKTIPGNGGDLGYFTVFDMIYPFETAAYNTKTGEVSNPVRTEYGYHIVYVTDRIPAIGKAQVKHLYLKIPENATHDDSVYVQKRIDSLYQRVMNGENFEELVKKYSDDKGSAPSGGVLPKFGVYRMLPEFIQAVNALKDTGDISKPVLTIYGWHIFKLMGKDGVPPFNDKTRDELKNKVKKDGRSQLSKEVIIERIKKEYGYKQYDNAIRELDNIVDSSLYNGKWEIPGSATLDKPVFSIGDKKFLQKDLAQYIYEHQVIGTNEKLYEFVNRMFKQFAEENCKQYENARLEEKYPDFKAIVQEYRDGILLFDLTDKMVWSKAVKDTTGLKKYYEEHKNDFMWGKRLDASIYYVKDTSYLADIRIKAEQGVPEEEILKIYGQDSLKVLKITHKKFTENENDIIDSIKWKKGITGNMQKNGKTVFVVVHAKIQPGPKTFNESKGLVTAAYQDYLEKEWIKQLREKYPVTVNEDVLQSIIEKEK